jgi:hypothetical protein
MGDPVSDLLTRAQAVGVTLWVESGEVRYRCRASSVPKTLLTELGSHRAALLIHLSNVGTKASDDALEPTFEHRPHERARVPTFRHATWNAVKSRLSAVDSTNLKFVVRVRGHLDLGALSFAFEEMRSRHEVLKATATEVDGQPWLVHGAQQHWEMAVRDVSHLPSHERADAARAMASGIVWQPIDLATGPLFHAFVIRVDTEEHVLGFVMHHLISDMISMGMLAEELIRNYSFKVAGHRAACAPATLQYGDYLLGSAEWLARPPVRARLQGWVDGLADAPAMDLARRPRGAPTPDYDCLRTRFEIGAEITAAIESSAQQFRVSKFVLLLTVQKLLLATLTGEDKVTMGAVISGRELPVLAPVVGYFADRMHWTTDLRGDPDFATAVARVHGSYIEAMRHQFFRSDMVQQELARRGKWLQAPVFNFVPYSRPRVRPTNARFANFPLDPPPSSTIPLPGISYWLALHETSHSMRGDLRFPHGSSEALARQFLAALELTVKSPTVRLSALRRAFANS